MGGWLFLSRKAQALTDKDTIVLADFDNKTGDAVFDDTLMQGLSVQLEQSPFLALISENKVNQTLKLMGRASDERLTPDVARDLCQRVGSKAYLSDYVVFIPVASQFLASTCQCAVPIVCCARHEFSRQRGLQWD